MVNPSKVRLDPKGGPEAAHHKAPDFLAQWAQGGGGNYDGAALDAEEAGGFVYRYSYGGVGEAAAWLASRGYAVIDVAAGPSAYGPVAGRGGAVTADSLPALRVRGNLRAEGGGGWGKGWAKESGGGGREEERRARPTSRSLSAMPRCANQQQPLTNRPLTITVDRQGVYRALLADLRDVGPTLTAQQHAQV